MNIYEIDREIEQILTNGIDPETGELTIDADALAALQMEKEGKIEGLALAWKNMVAEAAAVKKEADALSERKRVLENRAERIKEFLASVLNGEKFSTPKVVCSFRTTSSVEVRPEFFAWAEDNDPDRNFTRWKEPEANKKAIGDAIKRGQHIFGAEIVEKKSLSIK